MINWNEWTVITGFSPSEQGVFKHDRPPEKMNDYIISVQAMTWSDIKDKVEGKLVLNGIFGEVENGKFNIDCYIRGDEKKRVLTQHRRITNVTILNEIREAASLEFTAEADSGWQDVYFEF